MVERNRKRNRKLLHLVIPFPFSDGVNQTVDRKLAVRGAGDVLRLVQAMVMRKTFPDPIKVYSGTPS